MNPKFEKPLEIWVNEDLLLPNVRQSPLTMHLTPPDTNPELHFWNLLRDKLPDLVEVRHFTNLEDAGNIVVTPHYVSNYYALKKKVAALEKSTRQVLASKRTLVTFTNTLEYKPHQGEIVFASATYRTKTEKSIPTPQWIYDLGGKVTPIPKPSVPTVSFVGNTLYPSRLNSLILRYVKFSDSLVNWMAGSMFVNRSLNMGRRRLIARLVRQKVINEARKAQNIKTFLIERQGDFYTLPEEERKRKRAEYIESIQNNAYILVMRGDDNGCYQLWEAMSAGRIPVLIDTNRLLPDLGEMKWEDFCVIVPFSEVHRIGEFIQDFHARLSDEDFAEVCRKSRAAFEQMLPHNFVVRALEIIAKSSH